jgi:hypothetical protein
MTSPSMTYSVDAYNLSQASEKKIHDDQVAQKLGFTGGLVPGVEVFAYMTHPAVAKWGGLWLESGYMQASFRKPLYDGRTAIVTASVDTNALTRKLELTLKLESEGVCCATGEATVKPFPPGPMIDAYPRRIPRALRPPADEASLAAGTWLGTKPALLTEQRLHDYLRDVRERNDIYARNGIAHPGQLLRLCNAILVENVVLAPWIHTGSALQNFGVARLGDILSARARVVRNFEHNGHRSVELDVIVVANNRVVAQVLHTAIYKLRHLSGNA